MKFPRIFNVDLRLIWAKCNFRNRWLHWIQTWCVNLLLNTDRFSAIIIFHGPNSSSPCEYHRIRLYSAQLKIIRVTAPLCNGTQLLMRKLKLFEWLTDKENSEFGTELDRYSMVFTYWGLNEKLIILLLQLSSAMLCISSLLNTTSESWISKEEIIHLCQSAYIVHIRCVLTVAWDGLSVCFGWGQAILTGD